jgi:Glycogen recognition site of AMP-activated protein kinase
MKTDDINHAMPRLQTINGCLRVLTETCPAHSNDKPGVSFMTTSINVRFIPASLLEIPIKYQPKQPMKSALIENEPAIPSLFQIAERIKNYALPSILETTQPLSRTPFADLMLHPEKLEAALKSAKRVNDAFDAARAVDQSADNRATPNTPSKNNGARKSSNHSRSELKKTEFFLEAPFAESVKLAADFTDWEKFPLDMIKSEDGVWFIFVPLSPGNYYYRFIVDGKWCDDPHPILCVPNPFGTVNAVMNVPGTQT